MDKSEALRLIAIVADDPPSDIRRVQRHHKPLKPGGFLPAPEAAELRIGKLRESLSIIKGTRPPLRVDRRQHSQRHRLGGT